MDKQLIDNAHEIWAAAQLLPGEGIEDGAKRIAGILARIDAERGKDAVAFRLTDGDDVEYNGIDQFSCGRTGGEPLFLSPTILEGMAKDAERYRFIRMNRLWLKANLPLIAAPAFDEAIDAGLLAAAQGERK